MPYTINEYIRDNETKEQLIIDLLDDIEYQLAGDGYQEYIAELNRRETTE